MLVFALVFASGYWTAERKHTITDNLYETRLADLTNINKQLQDENGRINELNGLVTARLDEITGRLGKAKDIIGGLDGQIETDGDTIQRLVDNLQRLEQAISVIFEDK